MDIVTRFTFAFQKNKLPLLCVLMLTTQSPETYIMPLYNING
jgi:hypothetical protein